MDIEEFRFNGKLYAFSVLRWGAVKQSIARMTGASPHRFTPSCELAIYDRTQQNNPLLPKVTLVMHFINEKTLNSRYQWMLDELEKGVSMKECKEKIKRAHNEEVEGIDIM